MNKNSPVNKALLAIAVASLSLAVLLPLAFFTTLAFSSAVEVYEFPKKLLPVLKVKIEVSYIQELDSYKLRILRDGIFVDAITSNEGDVLSRYLATQLGVEKKGEVLLRDFSETREGGTRVFGYGKSLWYNFKTFFRITNKAGQALWNSVTVALMTILISLTLGSLCGFAMARYRFKGKEALSLVLLVVRMFPVVAISIPMVVLLMKLNLYDSMLGLAMLYSIPNIALTSWITNSIFLGINRELEEASMVFGATSIQTFMRITLPLALPALAASSMYAFLTAWNDTISAMILTNRHPTLALVVFKAIGGNMSSIQYAAAGSIVLIIPALVFTFVIRKYIGSMWGEVKV
jgi:multiple sugar transport system permease protein